MKMSLKEAKKRVFMGLKKLSKVFSGKEEKFLCMFSAFLMNEMWMSFQVRLSKVFS